MLSRPFDDLFGLDISSILENRPKELSLRQNESYLKQFCAFIVSHFPPSQRANDFPSLARPRSTRRDRGVAMLAGSLVGALAATQLADRIGRKKPIIIAGLII